MLQCFRRIGQWTFIIILWFFGSVMAGESLSFTPTPFEKAVLKTAPTLNPQVLNEALMAYQSAKRQGVWVAHPYLTIIDYSLPSSEKRLWLIDIKHQKSLLNVLVTHGSKSGALYPHAFSDRLGSHKSSVGLFRTGESYDGNQGYSMVLDGLEPGFNGNAKKRFIVMHSGWYATPCAVEKYGRLGRSWGCPVVDPQIVHYLIDTIKDGSLLFAYYPNSYWLHHSKFLSQRS